MNLQTMLNKIYIFLICITFLFLSCKGRNKQISEEEFNKTKKPLVEVNKILVKKDSEKIAAYVKRRNWNMFETGTGLWYMIIEKGSGTRAKKGLYATINYKISLLDGTECYDSDILGAKHFKIGQGSVVSGLEEGILLLHQGDKARFIIPPHLAHGLLGDEDKIPPRSILVYVVELLNLDNN